MRDGSRLSKLARKTVVPLWVIAALFVGCEAKLIIRGDSPPIPLQAGRTVVWGNHPMMVTTIMERVKQEGGTLIERARLKEILDEQRTRLTHTPDDESDLQRVGRLLGADTFIFAEATNTPAQYGNTVSNAFGRLEGSTATHFHVSVAIRSVAVETGEVKWIRAAHYERAISNPEAGIIALTEAAMGKQEGF